ncbi:ATP-binding cassette domain-containing protein [Amorphus orientalis]|uniref:Thiamine transport system ATP-binding protein n=1 Tax=Amorphus orientalis TaxID=649198 RepID=A0AAE3VN89_9HYPH|nr:ATP-binding cassette domain-containing protein [Amorphus orientalis]MDQ0315188.1 putative thiamine transport system ATP-binding protein [Amorphus orientalis]
MTHFEAGLTLDRVVLRKAGDVLVSLSATVAPGTVLTLMGPSGTGKSTLLAFVAGFLGAPFSASGDVWLDGRRLTELPPAERKVGLLFQDPLLFPHLSVGGNIRFAIPAGIRPRERDAAVTQTLAAVGLPGLERQDPATLSGGEQARVALARVLAARPGALLLDEPFSKLDSALKRQIRALVFDTARERDLPVLLVTHDPADAEAAGGEVVSLAD